jgi:hypothetical protein
VREPWRILLDKLKMHSWFGYVLSSTQNFRTLPLSISWPWLPQQILRYTIFFNHMVSLPSRTTHRHQSLHRPCFKPLTSYYGNGCSSLLREIKWFRKRERNIRNRIMLNSCEKATPTRPPSPHTQDRNTTSYKTDPEDP